MTRDPDVVFRRRSRRAARRRRIRRLPQGPRCARWHGRGHDGGCRDKARPFFGICVGMQMMATRGREHVDHATGSDWIAGDVEKITPRDESLKIPAHGLETLDMVREHPVLERLPLGPKGRHAYFVHSYHLNAANEADVLARADYGGPVTAIVGKDTAIGTQFHPEKSQRFGLALISNFLRWKP